MYLPNSAFHDAFKDPTTYPQDLYFGWGADYFSALDGDIESSGAEFDEYFCTADDITYGECPASTFKVSLINKGDLRSVKWNEWWRVKIGYRYSRVEDPLPEGVNARFRWGDADPDYSGDATEYFYAKTDGLYYGSTLIDGSGECYSFYATQSGEWLYAFGDGYTYRFEMDDPTDYQKVIMSRHMINKFSTPQSIYFDFDHFDGWQYTYRSKDGYTEVWHYIPMGMYYFEKPKNLSNAVVEIDCAYDFMQKFDTESTQLLAYMSEHYPSGATISDWNYYICTFTNVIAPIVPSGGDTYTIETTMASTLRELFAYVAQTQKGVFRYNRNGDPILYKIGTQAVEEVEARRIEESSLSVAEFRTGTPDAVINKTASGLTYINGQTPPENPYYILGNPFILGNDVTLADVAFPSYRPMSLVVLEADPCVDVGDLIDVQISPEQYKVLTDLYDHPYDDGDHSIYTIANQPLRMPLMHRLLHWNGVCTASYECTGNEYRLAPYGAELTDYNTNVANNTSNIINKIEAHGIDADWITTGILSDRNGNYSLDMDTGTVNMANANITGGSINIETSSADVDTIVLTYQSDSFTWSCTFNPAAIYAKRISTLGNIFEGVYSAGNAICRYIYPSGAEEQCDVQPTKVELSQFDTNLHKTVRVKLDYTGLYFYDASGNLTKSYPST